MKDKNTILLICILIITTLSFGYYLGRSATITKNKFQPLNDIPIFITNLETGELYYYNSEKKQYIPAAKIIEKK